MIQIPPKKSAKNRLGAYTRTALAILGTTAGIAALVVFPGLAIVAKEFLRHQRGRRAYSRHTMRNTLLRMEQRGFIRLVGKEGELMVQLTKDGKRMLKNLRYETLCIPPPTKWDGAWRLVAFDIPEKKRATRFLFRKKLREMGFVRIEKSLFLHPHPCTTEIAYLVDFLGIAPFVHLIHATSFNDDLRWQRHFKLRKSG